MGICHSDPKLVDHIKDQKNKAKETESIPTLTIGAHAINDVQNGTKAGGVDDNDTNSNSKHVKRISVQSTSIVSSNINHTQMGSTPLAPTAASLVSVANQSAASSETSTKSMSSFTLFRGKSNKAKKAQDLDKKREVSRRKESLQKKISILSFASAKIDQYKSENEELHDANEELNEINSELKEYIDDKNDIIVQQERDLKDLESKIMGLEQEVLETKNGNSINDILYKIQGDCVSKLKYTKMSAKRVIFINGINHLFYYDETESASIGTQLEAKCIVVRDILFCHDEIESILPVNKAWFLIIGAKRKALFIAECMATRDKWLYFIQNSLNLNNKLWNSNGSSHINNNSSYAMSISTATQSDYLQIPTRISVLSQSPSSPYMQNIPNIVISPRSGNTKIICESEEFEYRAISFNYPSAVNNCAVVNTGHMVQVNIHPSNKCKLNMNDGNIYRLKQFHFHVPSEHMIYSKQYEMELHLLHVNESNANEMMILCFIFSTKQKYKAPQLELNESKTHLIRKSSIDEIYASAKSSGKKKKKKIMRMLKKKKEKEKERMEETEDDETDAECEWNEDDENRNDFLDQFWAQLPPQKTKEEIPLNKPLNFEFLLKNASDNFIKNIKTNDININIPIYDYVGALRTPPYSEGVKWLISKKTHFINYKQLNTLKKIWYHYL